MKKSTKIIAATLIVLLTILALAFMIGGYVNRFTSSSTTSPEDEFLHCLTDRECEEKALTISRCPSTGMCAANKKCEFSCIPLPDENTVRPDENGSLGAVKIANWNLQVFGKTKASDDVLMRFYASKIRNYDIIFVQEIRDATGTAFPALCALLTDDGYACENSSRAGRSSSKEQYGVIYSLKRNVSITEFTDFNPDPADRWERPPLLVAFEVNNYSLLTYNVHTKPEDVTNELRQLEQLVDSDEGNVVILGDLNADCDYYNPETGNEFRDGFNWIVKDDDDTTVSATDCAYDRIILNDDSYQEFVSYGIDAEGITKDVSDHYLAWIELTEPLAG